MTTPARHHLRTGFTTGTAAAAATQAALSCLLKGQPPQQVRVALPTGTSLDIAVHACQRMDAYTAGALVIKDAGDDPDVTHGAEIGARVAWHPAGTQRTVTIRGGPGVGTVTKPGLENAPGQPAITAGPRWMITQAALQVLAAHGVFGHVVTEVFVPQGLALARHTLNARLGIVGGISILGTTGIVRPLSHEAYIATIDAALSVARAAGLAETVLTTGRRSERFAQARWPERPVEAFVQIGDHFGQAMGIAAARGFTRVILAVFFGKAVKMAQGMAHTHARSVELNLTHLGAWVLEISGDSALADAVSRANTARQVFDRIQTDCPAVIAKIGHEVMQTAIAFGDHRLQVRVVIFGFDGVIGFDSESDEP
jgi:cobalt-precorrin-5B (C1)-methyltransferase